MKYYDVLKIAEKEAGPQRIDEDFIETLKGVLNWFREVLIAIFGKNAEKAKDDANKILADPKLTMEEKKAGLYNSYVTMANNTIPEQLVRKYRTNLTESYSQMFNRMLNEALDATARKNVMDTVNVNLTNLIRATPAKLQKQPDGSALFVIPATPPATEDIKIIITREPNNTPGTDDTFKLSIKYGNEDVGVLNFSKTSTNADVYKLVNDMITAGAQKTVPGNTVSNKELAFEPVFINLIPVKKEDVVKNIIQAKFKILGYGTDYDKTKGTYRIVSNVKDSTYVKGDVKNYLAPVAEAFNAQVVKDPKTDKPLMKISFTTAQTLVDAEQPMTVEFNEEYFKKAGEAAVGGKVTLSAVDVLKDRDTAMKTSAKLDKNLAGTLLEQNGKGIEFEDPKDKNRKYTVQRASAEGMDKDGKSVKYTQYLLLKRFAGGAEDAKFNSKSDDLKDDTVKNKVRDSVNAYIRTQNRPVTMGGMNVVGDSPDGKGAMLDPLWSMSAAPTP